MNRFVFALMSGLLFHACALATVKAPTPLATVCAFRFANQTDIELTETLADEFAKISILRQRMFQPKSAEWSGKTLFATPSIYWIQYFLNAAERAKGMKLAAKVKDLASRAEWSTCFDATILDGNPVPWPAALGTINNYFPFAGKFDDALAIRIKVTELMTQANACPPYILVPVNSNATEIGMLAVYEEADETQLEECAKREYAPNIIAEVEKMDPLLSSFSRMRSTIIYGN